MNTMKGISDIMKTTRDLYDRVRTMWCYADYFEDMYILMCEISMRMIIRGDY